MTRPQEPTTPEQEALEASMAGQGQSAATVIRKLRERGYEIGALRAVPEPPRELDRPLTEAVLRFYADQMPAYAAAADLNREEYAAVMVDVRKVRAALQEDR